MSITFIWFLSIWHWMGKLLSSQQNLQPETVSVMNEMSKRHENEQFTRDIQIFNRKIFTSMSGLPKLKR